MACPCLSYRLSIPFCADDTNQVEEHLRVIQFWKIAILLSVIRSIKWEFTMPLEETVISDEIENLIEQWMHHIGRLLGYMPGGFFFGGTRPNSS